MGPKTEQLIGVLRELEQLLGRYGERQWATWMGKSAQALRSGDFHGITHLLSAFGGMGSLNDVVLHPLNGHALSKSEVEPVNRQFGALTSTAWNLAREIEREVLLGD